MDVEAILSVTPFDWHAIGTSLLCGSIIGIERQLRGKPGFEAQDHDKLRRLSARCAGPFDAAGHGEPVAHR